MKVSRFEINNLHSIMFVSLVGLKESNFNDIETIVINEGSVIIEEQEEIEDPKDINFDSSIVSVSPVDGNDYENVTTENDDDRDIVTTDLNMKYKCPVCGKLMLSLTKAEIHSQNCGKKKSAKCYVCGEQFLYVKCPYYN